MVKKRSEKCWREKTRASAKPVKDSNSLKNRGFISLMLLWTQPQIKLNTSACTRSNINLLDFSKARWANGDHAFAVINILKGKLVAHTQRTEQASSSMRRYLITATNADRNSHFICPAPKDNTDCNILKVEYENAERSPSHGPREPALFISWLEKTRLEL